MIIFTEHAKAKIQKELKKLGITKQLTAQILKNPDELLYDVLTGRYVALNWTHNTAIIYEKTKRNITVVTIIYSSELMDIVNKRKRVGRWI
jgi:predicted transcriptional regulator